MRNISAFVRMPIRSVATSIFASMCKTAKTELTTYDAHTFAQRMNIN